MIPTITEPNLERVIEVEQRSFGVLTPDSGKEYIETIGIGPCIGVYMEEGDTKVLTHLDALNVRNVDIDHIFQYFQQQWTEFKPSRAILIASAQTNEANIAKVKEYLEKNIINIEVDCSNLNIISIVVDNNGSYSHIDKLKPRNIDANTLEIQRRLFEQSIKRDPLYRLKCVTDENTWQGLKLLPSYRDSYRGWLGRSNYTGLPFDVIVDEDMYYQFYKFLSSEEMSDISRQTQSEKNSGNVEYPNHLGDSLVRILSPEEVNKIKKIINQN